MIIVVKNNFENEKYYMHTCDKCESLLVFKENDMTSVYNMCESMSFRAVKCPLCKTKSYMNEFQSISEDLYRAYYKEMLD